MAQGVLLLARHFGKRPARPLGHEQCIVTEPARAALGRRDHAFDRAVENADHFTALGQSQHAAESSGTLLAAHLAQPFEQQRPVRGHIGIIPGITRRTHAGRPAEGVHLEAGIIGQDPAIVVRRPDRGLQPRIILERRPRLFDVRQIWPRRQVLDLPIATQNFPNLARFVRIARGQEQALL